MSASCKPPPSPQALLSTLPTSRPSSSSPPNRTVSIDWILPTKSKPVAPQSTIRQRLGQRQRRKRRQGRSGGASKPPSGAPSLLEKAAFKMPERLALKEKYSSISGTQSITG